MESNKKQALIKIIWTAISAIVGLLTGLNCN